MTGILSLECCSTPAAGTWVQRNKKTGAIKVVGFYFLDQTVQLVQSGDVQATIDQAPEKQGFEAVDLLVQFLNGKPIESVDTGVGIYTKENIEQGRQEISAPAKTQSQVTSGVRISVEIAGVTKRFPGVLALDRIHVGFRAAEVHAVVGENGAGKSTLMHILAGDLQPNEGELLVDGKATHFASPLDSRAAGIVVVYQELALCPTMTIAENVVMSDMARRRVVSLVPRAMMRTEARAALGRLRHQPLDPDTRVSRLSVAEMHLVEIARAIRQRARVLVLDEPNSALSRRESERLFDVVRSCAPKA